MNKPMPSLFTETPWESRNLGVKSFTLNNDQLNIITQQLLIDEMAALQFKFGKQFIFARLPKSHLHLATYLQHCEFYLVEGSVCPVIQFNKSTLLQDFIANRTQFIPERFRERDINFITLDNRESRPSETLKSIARESFNSGRFHADFNCSESLANRRLELWINDLLNNHKVTFDIIEVDGEIAGFMARKENHLILAGFSHKHVGFGLGQYLWLGSLYRMQDDGCRYAKTLVSTNNIPSLNLHARLGFKFRNPQYAFHYWSHRSAPKIGQLVKE